MSIGEVGVEVDAFWAHVDKTGECWLWNGRIHKGYGSYWGRGFAHRLAYQLLKGQIPPGLELDHLCRTPLCVNPAHLEPVTRAENIRRRSALITQCIYGHKFDEANTHVDAKSKRSCRACWRRRTAECKARRLARLAGSAA